MLIFTSKDKGRTTLSLNKQSVSLSNHDKKITDVKQSNEQTMPWHSTIVYLKIVADFRFNRDLATFFYSQNGHTWHQLGEPFHMVYDFRRLFMGTRVAIFNYATEQLGGRVDVDYYTIKVSEKPEE